MNPRILRSPDEGASAPADPAATSAGSQPEPQEPAPPKEPEEPEPPTEGDFDFDSLPDGMREPMKRAIEAKAKTQAESLAEDRFRAKVGADFAWLTKEEREEFAKHPTAYREMKERAGKVADLEREIERLKTAPEPKTQEAVEKRQEKIDRLEERAAKLDADFEHTEVEQKWVRGIMQSTRDAVREEYDERIAALEANLSRAIDARLTEREQMQRVTTSADWTDPEIGPVMQEQIAGIMWLAANRGSPVSIEEAQKIALERWSGIKAKLSGNGAAKPPVPAAKPAAPAPQKVTIPPLGDMGGRTSGKGSEPEIDVQNDDQMLEAFLKEPVVQAYDKARRIG